MAGILILIVFIRPEAFEPDAVRCHFNNNTRRLA